MKIVYIYDVFHPDAGYQANILSKYWVKFGHEVYIFTSEMKKIPSHYTDFFDIKNLEEKDLAFEKRTGVKILRFPLLTYKSGRAVYSKCLFKKLREKKPDVVFVNGNDSLIGIQLILKYKKNDFGLVTDSHMLEMASANRFNNIFRIYYKLCVTPLILKYNIPVIRTQDDDYVEKCLGLPLNRCPLISFGTDMSLFNPNGDVKKKFREENNISNNAFIVAYAGKIIKSKGAEILAKAAQTRIKSAREIVFLIVGNTEGEFGKRIEGEFKKSKHRIIRLPTQRYQELPAVYQVADIAVFPKQCSLSFFDVQACGLPVIFEDNNINVDRSGYHNAVTYRTDCVEDFCDKISFFANMNEEELNKYKRNAIELVRKTYDYELKAREYIPYLEQQARAKNRL